MLNFHQGHIKVSDLIFKYTQIWTHSAIFTSIYEHLCSCSVQNHQCSCFTNCIFGNCSLHQTFPQSAVSLFLQFQMRILLFENVKIWANFKRTQSSIFITIPDHLSSCCLHDHQCSCLANCTFGNCSLHKTFSQFAESLFLEFQIEFWLNFWNCYMFDSFFYTICEAVTPVFQISD